MTYGRVEHVEQLTPHMVRVVFGGEGLADFATSEWTDAYVNLLFLPPDAPYAVPFDLEWARSLPRDQWPRPRRYSVREWDEERRLLTIDFVVHGDSGVAGPWAANASPGDLLQLRGPSGAYLPDQDAEWHLMIGDESALPAIAASLTRVPAGVPAVVIGLVDSLADELELECPGRMELTWVHRDSAPGDPELLMRVVEKLDFPPGRPHAFVHGEAVETRAVRRHLLGERGIERECMSVSPYWRRTMTDESWRDVKRDWLREVEQDV